MKAWPDGVVAAYFVWDDVTRVQILVRPCFCFYPFLVILFVLFMHYQRLW